VADVSIDALKELTASTERAVLNLNSFILSSRNLTITRKQNSKTVVTSSALSVKLHRQAEVCLQVETRGSLPDGEASAWGDGGARDSAIHLSERARLREGAQRL